MLFWVLIMAVVLLFVSMQMQGEKHRSITVSQFHDYVESGQLVGKVDAYVDRIEGQNPEGRVPPDIGVIRSPCG